MNSCLVVGHSAETTLGGAELSLIQMIWGLNELGLSVVVAIPHLENKSYNDAILQTGSSLILMPIGQRLIGGFVESDVVEAYTELILKERFMFVATNTIIPFAPLIAASSLKIPSVVFLREDFYNPELLEFVNANSLFLKLSVIAESDYIVCNSQYLMSQFAKSNNIFHLRNTPAEIQGLLEIKSSQDLENSLRVSMLGTISREKGIYDFLKIAEVLRNYDIQFQLFGGLRFDQNISLLEGLPSNVEYFGYVSDQNQIFQSTDLLISLSRRETFGRTIVEAMAAGKPVISWNQGGRKELIVDGVTGFTHTLGDIDSFADSIKFLALNGDNRLQFGEAGRQIVRRDWNNKKYLDDLTEIIKRVQDGS